MSRVTYFVRMAAKEGKVEEVKELLLTNPQRIRQGEPGNIVFAVHRSVDDPNEFWLYETWESEETVEPHESGEAFEDYMKRLRPPVEGASVVRGNTTPIDVIGYDE